MLISSLAVGTEARAFNARNVPALFLSSHGVNPQKLLLHCVGFLQHGGASFLASFGRLESGMELRCCWISNVSPLPALVHFDFAMRPGPKAATNLVLDPM